MGVFNASGQLLSFAAVETACRAVTGATTDAVRVASRWLVEQGVAEFSGPRSLPLWITDREAAGFSSRNTDAAVAAGLTWRPIEELVESTLAWERERGLGRERQAGLSPGDERELVAAWHHHQAAT